LAEFPLGDSGSINIKTGNLILRDRALLTALNETNQIGNGGNINIAAENIILDRSTINASTEKGQGENIRINTLGIFQKDSCITASSTLGIDGNLEINANPQAGRDNFNLILQPKLTENLLAQSCITRNTSNSSFVNAGQSGLPINPNSGIDRSENAIDVPRPSSIEGESSESLPIDVPPLSQVNKLPTDITTTSPTSEIPFLVTIPESSWNLGDPIVEARSLNLTRLEAA
jgi:hypothetical protein